MDNSTLFTNVRILDGTGTMPYAGSVLVQGNRIRTVSRSSASLAPSGAIPPSYIDRKSVV